MAGVGTAVAMEGVGTAVAVVAMGLGGVGTAVEIGVVMGLEAATTAVVVLTAAVVAKGPDEAGAAVKVMAVALDGARTAAAMEGVATAVLVVVAMAMAVVVPAVAVTGTDVAKEGAESAVVVAAAALRIVHNCSVRSSAPELPPTKGPPSLCCHRSTQCGSRCPRRGG